jgi:hypothetical protein
MAKASDMWKTALAAGVLVIGALALTGAVNLPGIPSPLSAGDQPDQEQTSGERAQVNAWDLSSQVTFPQAPSSAEVCAFTSQPDNWENHVDFTMSKAKKGLSAGVDYYCTSSITSKTPDLGHIPSGDYFLAAEDSNYHDLFQQVTVPDTVQLAFAEQDKNINLVDSSAFDQTVTYDSDNTVTYDEHDGTGSTQKTSADLNGGNFVNGTRDASLVRTIQIDTGTAYLGKHNVSSFNDGDGIQDVSVTLMVDGQQVYTKDLKDGSSGELSDSTSFGEDIESNVDTDPVKAQDTIKTVYDFTLDSANVTDTTAGDSQVGVGESVIDQGIRDIYDAAVGTSTSISTTN